MVYRRDETLARRFQQEDFPPKIIPRPFESPTAVLLLQRHSRTERGTRKSAYDEAHFAIKRYTATADGWSHSEVRFRGKADIDRHARLGGSVENDPERTSPSLSVSPFEPLRCLVLNWRKLKSRIGWEMNMRTTLAVLTLLASLTLASPVHAQIVSDSPSLLIAVRHADTLAEPVGDRALSDAGIIRSQALALAVRNAGVTAIITSQFRRSRDTPIR